MNWDKGFKRLYIALSVLFFIGSLFFSYGETDDFGYNIVKDPVHVHDLQATILNQFGIDHERMTYKFQGRRFRLTDVHGEVKKELLDI